MTTMQKEKVLSSPTTLQATCKQLSQQIARLVTARRRRVLDLASVSTPPSDVAPWSERPSLAGLAPLIVQLDDQQLELFTMALAPASVDGNGRKVRLEEMKQLQKELQQEEAFERKISEISKRHSLDAFDLLTSTINNWEEESVSLFGFEMMARGGLDMTLKEALTVMAEAAEIGEEILSLFGELESTDEGEE